MSGWWLALAAALNAVSTGTCLAEREWLAAFSHSVLLITMMTMLHDTWVERPRQ